MPSPFVHLYIAEKIRNDICELQSANIRLTGLIIDGWPAFYFGSAAPDYQTLSGQPREETHFYKLPPEPGNKAYPRMFARYTQLAAGDSLPIEHASFIAAYAAHLILDLIWFRDILIPYFHDAPGLGELQDRRLLHLILLTYLDKLAFETLPEHAALTLAAAIPRQWLPFAKDSDLRSWRDFLVAQLQPGTTSQTVSIYAKRLQMTADAFAAKLEDTVWMEDHLFSKVPVMEVRKIVDGTVPACITVIVDYLNGHFA